MPRTRSRAKRTRLVTPTGVAWPTVSHRARPSAPSSMAAVNSRRRVVGCDRTVSSVTKVQGRPASLAIRTAVRQRFSSTSSSQPSAYSRMGEVPRKVMTSTGMPTRSAISMTGRMSAGWVRAAHWGLIASFSSRMKRTSASESATARGPAPGRPTSRLSTPTSDRRRTIRILSSMEGSVMDGLWMPSRSVSSMMAMRSTRGWRTGPSRFQS